MKKSKIIVGLILVIFVICLNAQSHDTEYSYENRGKILWVVDGVQLKDSVFDYTLAQMKSDCADVLASRVLSWVYPNDIVGISVKDSTEALKYGFTDYNGIINIATTFREPLLVIINGIVNKTKGKVSAGEILGGFDYIQHIIEDEFEDLKDYGIKDCVILKEVNIFCHRLRIPVVVVMTEKPYYRIDNFEGKYTGKRGKQSYKLKLNSDSTYEFSRRNIHEKAISPKISDYGNWNISDGEIILISSQDPATLLQGYTVSLDTAHLKIKSINTLTLPKGTWNNKKTITLKQQYDETDQ